MAVSVVSIFQRQIKRLLYLKRPESLSIFSFARHLTQLVGLSGVLPQKLRYSRNGSIIQKVVSIDLSRLISSMTLLPIQAVSNYEIIT